MKKFLIIAALCAVLSSCSLLQTVTPYEHGYAVGVAVYAGYSRIADGNEPFAACCAVIWEKVNAIDSTDTLVIDIAGISGAFDSAMENSSLSDADKATVTSLRNMALNRIDGKLNEAALSNADAVEFLKGVRAGVNGMIMREAVK